MATIAIVGMPAIPAASLKLTFIQRVEGEAKRIEIDLESVGAGIEKAITFYKAQAPALAVALNTTLAAIDPALVLPAEAAESAINISLGAASAIAAAASAGGVNLAADQLAIVQAAAAATSLKAGTTTITLVTPAPAAA